MAEPRMRARAKGQQFSTADLETLLTAFGSAGRGPALPTTVTALDSIITDFIIETCHAAAQSASYSHRQKIKVEDFKFALRRDPKKLGRVTELLSLDRDFKRERKAFQVEEEELARREANAASGGAGAGDGTTGAGKRGRKRAAESDGEQEEGDMSGDGDGSRKKKKRKKPGRKPGWRKRLMNS